MTATLDGAAKKKQVELSAEQQAAVELVRAAKEAGLSLTGPDGLLQQFTTSVLETALNEEMTEHLGCAKHDPAGAGTGSIRNGTRAKTVLTEATGQVEIEVPRGRAGLIRNTFRLTSRKYWDQIKRDLRPIHTAVNAAAAAAAMDQVEQAWGPRYPA